MKIKLEEDNGKVIGYFSRPGEAFHFVDLNLIVRLVKGGFEIRGEGL